MTGVGMPEFYRRDVATGELAYPSTQPRLTDRVSGKLDGPEQGAGLTPGLCAVEVSFWINFPSRQFRLIKEMDEFLLLILLECPLR
jgi:hypothetical protein